MTLTSEKSRLSNFNRENIQYCRYCSRECHNINSLKQHEVRCNRNPNRRAYNNLGSYTSSNRRGKTKFNDAGVAKYCETIRKKYENGYINPRRGTKRKPFEYIYQEHNDCEIEKWRQYVTNINVQIPQYEVYSHGHYKNSYNCIMGMYSKHDNTICVVFEHDFVANIYLRGNLLPGNTVHHIDKIPKIIKLKTLWYLILQTNISVFIIQNMLT